MKHPYITPQITIRPANLPKFSGIKEIIDIVNSFPSKIDEEIEMHMRVTAAKELDRHIENICRNYLDPPIKGEITKGKLRWRGVKGIVQQRTLTPNGFALDFRGILQRDTLITIAGEKIPYKYIDQDRNTCNPFLPTSTS